MIRTLYADEAPQYPELFKSMHKHRATQFHDRLGWEVNVDEHGQERDEYDQMNPVYLIMEGNAGEHLGSMRFLPTTGDTMVNDHFTTLTAGMSVRSPRIWECSRFCLSPSAGRGISRTVLVGTLELGLQFGLQFFVGVFSKKMLRIYDRIGWAPKVIGEGVSYEDTVCAGLWPISLAARDSMLARYDFSSYQPLSRPRGIPA